MRSVPSDFLALSTAWFRTDLILALEVTKGLLYNNGSLEKGVRMSKRPIPTDDDGVDVVGGVPPDHTLDSFVQEMFGESPKTSESGLPSFGALKQQFKTKSAIIRHLAEHHNLDVKTIAAHTGFRYQMVRNVLTNVLKRGPNEDFHLGEGQAVSGTSPEPNDKEMG